MTTSSDAANTGQVSASAAETYEDFFVPALFDQWPDQVLVAVGLRPGDRVLDVGCGTGVLARAAARALQGTGSVAGLDCNEGMLAVARRSHHEIAWTHGPAEHLPFADNTFDRVVSQFALMFFDDPAAGIEEMARVARPGGTVAVATWADASESPGYAAMIGLLQRLFGDAAADALSAPFTIGTEEALAALMQPSLPHATVTRLDGTARFDSLEAWVHTDVRGWTLADMIDDDQYAELLAAATTDLAHLVGPDGSVTFPAPALLAVSAT